MDKQFLKPVQLLHIASQHAYCADYILHQKIVDYQNIDVNTLLPTISLIHIAFELTLKAYIIHEGRPLKPYKNLLQLVEFNIHLGLSKQELQLLHTLVHQLTFRKGTEYPLWKNTQELHVFCEDLLSLYERIQTVMPVELQADYINDSELLD